MFGWRYGGAQVFLLFFGSLEAMMLRRGGALLRASGFRSVGVPCVRRFGSESGSGSDGGDDLSRPPMSTLFRLPTSGTERVRWVRAWKAHSPTLFAAGGGVLATYGISKAVLWMTSTFLHMDLQTMGGLGFVAGLGTAGLSAVGGIAVFRVMSIRPEVVFHHVLAEVKAHPKVKAALGYSLQPGALRAYTLRQGGLGWSQTTPSKFGWQLPRIQLLFQLKGTAGEAMVSVEAERRGLSLHTTFLAVDILQSSHLKPKPTSSSSSSTTTSSTTTTASTTSSSSSQETILIHSSPHNQQLHSTLRDIFFNEREKYFEHRRKSPEQAQDGTATTTQNSPIDRE